MVFLLLFIAGDKKHTSTHLRRAAYASTLLTFDDYYKFTVTSLKSQFPIQVRSIGRNCYRRNGRVCKRYLSRQESVFASETVKVANMDDLGYAYYIKVARFYDETKSLILEGGELERLRLYFTLQYGEIEWR